MGTESTKKSEKNKSGVYKRGKVYWIHYSVGGVQYRESTKTRNKELAVRLYEKRRQEIFEGRFFPDKKNSELTMEGLRKLWLEHASHKRTVDDDRQRFETIVEYFGPSTLIASLTPSDIDRFREVLSKRTTRMNRAMTPATVNRHLGILRSALRLAQNNGYFLRLRTLRFDFLRENNERDRICTTEEYQKLIDAASPKLRLAIILGYCTAMRLGEIINLDWKQIDLTSKLIRLESSDTKTGKPRRVPLDATVIEELKTYPRSIDGRLFGETSRDAISSAFRKLCKRVGVDSLRFHDLRHTALTNLRRAGVDVFVLQAISGHKTLKMLGRYQTVTDDDLRKAVETKERSNI
ncbi:MAG: site-specific integrase [Deltaproteobacteria bacterium]|nr:site-specific integrase [Deltaproteobacteria bacterium]